ncbi:hypothetical protein I4U23_020035 [Adineta vaga]|nr:hypothetical protein I4U23_020035 [Adineta vaga]
MRHSKRILWLKMITFCTIAIACFTLLILNQIPSVENQNIQLASYNVSRESQTSTIHHMQDGIHLAIVCTTQHFNQLAIASIKSIMFHHRKSYNLTFHIFTDTDGEKLISTFYSSITNACTKFRIYSIYKLLKMGKQFLRKHHITNEHYSGIYAFSKALIHDVLDHDIQHIILIDTDVIFVDDVYSIWKQFELFTRNKTALGLVPWYPALPTNYTYNTSAPDPFLTGVVLLDLNICRLIGFTQLLDKAIDIAYQQFGLRSLWSADQTALSLFATYFPEHFVTLPCFVNGHTFHYLTDGLRWKSGCNGEYPHNLHVVPSNELLNATTYFGHWYAVFNEMPIEWLSYCNQKKPQIVRRTKLSHKSRHVKSE